MNFCSARYALRTMDTTFIQNTVLKVTAMLSCYGFIVDTLAADGASENCSANKIMATITAKDIFGDMFSKGETAEYPLDMKVVFHHPTRPSSIICIGGEINVSNWNYRDRVERGVKLCHQNLYLHEREILRPPSHIAIQGILGR
jgi:hypothetical protein